MSKHTAVQMQQAKTTSKFVWVRKIEIASDTVWAWRR